MARASQPIPRGFHTVTASLIVHNAAEAIEFYKKALGAKERMRMKAPDGKIGHAELEIGDSIVFLSDEYPNMGGKSPRTAGTYTGALYLYVPDVDKSFQQAVDAGGKVTMPVTDMFWGDRYGQFMDPFGHYWGLSTHTEDLTEPEIAERSKAFFESMAQKEKMTA